MHTLTDDTIDESYGVAVVFHEEEEASFEVGFLKVVAKCEINNHQFLTFHAVDLQSCIHRNVHMF